MTKTTTVAELLLALASYPQDAEVTMSDPFVDLGVIVDGDYFTVYHKYEGAAHYERPDIIVREVERGHPGDDYATAQEFLEWLRSRGITLAWMGRGHGELDTPIQPDQRARLAEQYASRETSA